MPTEKEIQETVRAYWDMFWHPEIRPEPILDSISTTLAKVELQGDFTFSYYDEVEEAVVHHTIEFSFPEWNWPNFNYHGFAAVVGDMVLLADTEWDYLDVLVRKKGHWHHLGNYPPECLALLSRSPEQDAGSASGPKTTRTGTPQQ